MKNRYRVAHITTGTGMGFLRSRYCDDEAGAHELARRLASEGSPFDEWAVYDRERELAEDGAAILGVYRQKGARGW